MADITPPDIPPLYVKPILENDDVGSNALMNIELTVQGAARTIQGVYFMAVPQSPPDDADPTERFDPYPAIVISAPYVITKSSQIIPNGPPLTGGTFGQDVMLQARDVAPNDPQLLKMRARIKWLLEGTRGPVVGGLATTVYVEDFPPPQWNDKGDYPFSQIGITFGIGSEVSQ